MSDSDDPPSSPVDTATRVGRKSRYDSDDDKRAIDRGLPSSVLGGSTAASLSSSPRTRSKTTPIKTEPDDADSARDASPLADTPEKVLYHDGPKLRRKTIKTEPLVVASSSTHDHDEQQRRQNVEDVSSRGYKEYARLAKKRLSKVEEMMPDGLSEELFLAWKMIRDLTKGTMKSHCAPFMEKVNAVELGLLDYDVKIKRPMWFNRIFEKFDNNEYGSILDVLDDFYLVLENCLRYNGPDHYISKKALKLDTSMSQKVSLLPRELKDMVINTMSPDSGHLQCYDMHKIAQSMRVAGAVKRRQSKKQEIMDKRQRRQLEEDELNVWYKELIGHEAEWEEFRALYELPQIGHMVYLCQEALHYPEMHTHQTILERGFYMPRESTALNKLMTVLLQSPTERIKFFKSRRGSFPYHQWNNRLRFKLAKWYQKLRTLNRNAEAAAVSLSIEPKFFSVLSKSNPLAKRAFHELTPYQRIWIVKSLIDQIVDTQDSVKQAIETNAAADQTEYRLGTDAYGYNYIHFPQFCGNDIRVYRCAPEPPDLPILRPCVYERPAKKRRHREARAESGEESDTNSTPRKKGRRSRSPSPSDAESAVSAAGRRKSRKRRDSSDLSDTDADGRSDVTSPRDRGKDDAKPRTRDMRKKLLSRLVPFGQYEETNSCDSIQSFGSIDMNKVDDSSSESGSESELEKSASAFSAYKNDSSDRVTEEKEKKTEKTENDEKQSQVKSKSGFAREKVGGNVTGNKLSSGDSVIPGTGVSVRQDGDEKVEGKKKDPIFYPSPMCGNPDCLHWSGNLNQLAAPDDDDEPGCYSDTYDDDAYTEMADDFDHAYCFRAKPIVNRDEEDFMEEIEEEPEVKGPDVGEFELVAMDLPELCTLIEKLESEGAKSPKKKLKNWMPLSERRKAEEDLLVRLRFLRSELEPYRWKFNHAQNKLRDRIRRDFDEFLEPPDPVKVMNIYILKLTAPGDIDPEEPDPSDWLESMVPDRKLLREYELVRLVNEGLAHTSILDYLELPSNQLLIKTDGGFSLHHAEAVYDSKFTEIFEPQVVNKRAMRVRYGMPVPEEAAEKVPRTYKTRETLSTETSKGKKKKPSPSTSRRASWTLTSMSPVPANEMETSQAIYGYFDRYFHHQERPRAVASKMREPFKAKTASRDFNTTSRQTPATSGTTVARTFEMSSEATTGKATVMKKRIAASVLNNYSSATPTTSSISSVQMCAISNTPSTPVGFYSVSGSTLTDLKTKLSSSSSSEGRMIDIFRVNERDVLKASQALSQMKVRTNPDNKMKAEDGVTSKEKGVHGQEQVNTVTGSESANVQIKTEPMTVASTVPQIVETLFPSGAPIVAVQPTPRTPSFVRPLLPAAPGPAQPLNMVEIKVQAVPHIISTALGNIEGYLTTQGVFIPKDGGRLAPSGVIASSAVQLSNSNALPSTSAVGDTTRARTLPPSGIVSAIPKAEDKKKSDGPKLSASFVQSTITPNLALLAEASSSQPTVIRARPEAPGVAMYRSSQPTAMVRAPTSQYIQIVRGQNQVQFRPSEPSAQSVLSPNIVGQQRVYATNLANRSTVVTRPNTPSAPGVLIGGQVLATSDSSNSGSRILQFGDRIYRMETPHGSSGALAFSSASVPTPSLLQIPRTVARTTTTASPTTQVLTHVTSAGLVSILPTRQQQQQQQQMNTVPQQITQHNPVFQP